MATIAKLAVLLDLDDNTFTQGLENSRKSFDKWGQSFRNWGTKLTAGVTTPILAAGVGLVKWGADLENTMATTEKVFGSASDQVIAFSNTSAKSLGIAKTDALDYQIYFAGMLDKLAEGPGELANMSGALTTLTSDFGAFFNLNPEESFTVIQSALAGETEAIRRYGVDVSAAAVETKALELGLAGTAAELTEQDKLLARYHILMEDTAHMTGQFADEADSVSGKAKILQARFKDLGTNISRHLLPYASDLLGWAEDIMGWLERLSPTTQRWVLAIAAAAAALGPLLIAIGFLLPALSTGLGLFAAMVSPIGLVIAAVGVLAFLFRDELMSAIQGVIEFIGNIIEGWQQLGGEMGIVERGLRAVQFALAMIGGENTPEWISALARSFGRLANAVRDDGLLGLIQQLGSEFARLGGYILDSVQNINWEEIRNSLWSGIQSAASWVGEQVLEIPSIAVDVLQWVAGKIQDVWEWLTGHVFGGNKGDGTGGATDPGFGGVTIPQVALHVLGWVAGQIADAWDFLRRWVMGETGGVLSLPNIVLSVIEWVQGTWPSVSDFLVEKIGKPIASIPEVLLHILSWDPVFNEQVDKAIRDKLGQVVVYGLNVLLDGILWAIEEITEADTTTIAQMIFYALAAAAIFVSAIPVAIAIAPYLAPLAIFLVAALLGYQIAQWLTDYFIANPMDAIELAIKIKAVWDKVVSGLPSKTEIAETIINEILGATGAPFEISLPISFSIGGDDENNPYSEDADLPNHSGSNSGKMFGGDFGALGAGSSMGTAAGGRFTGLAELGRQIATELDNIKVNTIEPKAAEWGASLAAKVNTFPGLATPGFAGISAVAGLHMGATSMAVETSGATMLGSLTARLLGMLGSAITNFGAIRSTGVSETTQLGTNVASTLATMTTNADSSFSTMATRGISETSRMRTGTISEAGIAGAGITRELTSGGANAVAGLGREIGRAAGVVQSQGSGAIGAAETLGRNIGEGLARGLEAMGYRVGQAAANLVAEASAAIALAGEISSPSRLFMRYGEYMGEGLARGIESTNDRVSRATADLVNVPDAFARAGTSGSGETKQYFFALTSEEFKQLLEKAENGNAFAAGFGGELAMFEGEG